ncbi:unnamed protein product [Triticum turgidum subsp. durum]|uniref:Uncharacterized protein n=1 Tax=Triticum turgidum subsp. durum TaxID=4567 RepID=A0A9R1Q5K0_TRITD|nr:unnamed protein product [Triticum turgidum subsp. durum]
MTIIDFIDVIDDIVDLSGDEETVERATLLGTQALMILSGEGRQDAHAGEGRQDDTESGNALVAATSSPSMEKAPLDTAVSQNSPHSPTAALFASSATTTPTALSSERSDAKLVSVKVKRPGRNYHTGGTPRRSPRLEENKRCRNKSTEELAADCKSPNMLEQAEESAASSQNAGSAKILYTNPAN